MNPIDGQPSPAPGGAEHVSERIKMRERARGRANNGVGRISVDR